MINNWGIETLEDAKIIMGSYGYKKYDRGLYILILRELEEEDERPKECGILINEVIELINDIKGVK